MLPSVELWISNKDSLLFSPSMEKTSRKSANRPKRPEVIPSTSLPVGIIDAPDIEHTRRRLRSGDLLVLASDGVAEAFGGSEGLLDRIKKLKQDKSPKRLARELLDEARQKETPYPDDMTLILAQITA